METIKFSVLKEKIIKTDELLQVLLENKTSLDRTRKCNRQLEKKLELCTSEVKKLKLKSETYAFNSRSSIDLQAKHDALKLQFHQLESESNKTINNLQINYQLVNEELEKCKMALSQLDKPELTDTPKKLQASPKVKEIQQKNKKRNGENADLRREIDELKQRQNDGTYIKDFTKLQMEKDKLKNETGNLELQIYELRKQLKEREFSRDDADRLEQLENEVVTRRQELVNFRNKCHSGEERIRELVERVNEVEFQRNKADTESEKLRNEIKTLQATNAELVAEINKFKMIKRDDVFESDVRENVRTPCDEEICEIMKDISPPARLSPVDHQESCTEKNVPLSGTSPSDFLWTEPHIKTSTADKNFRSFDAKRKRKFPNKRLLRRRSRNIDLLGALVALKKAKIHFVLSNDPIQSNVICQQSQTFPFKEPKLRKKTFNTSVTKLTCTLPCCQESHMLLQDAQLLGFFKGETKSQLNGDSVKIASPKNQSEVENYNSKREQETEEQPPCADASEQSDDKLECNVGETVEKLQRNKRKSSSVVSVISNKNITRCPSRIKRVKSLEANETKLVPDCIDKKGMQDPQLLGFFKGETKSQLNDKIASPKNQSEVENYNSKSQQETEVQPPCADVSEQSDDKLDCNVGETVEKLQRNKRKSGSVAINNKKVTRYQSRIKRVKPIKVNETKPVSDRIDKKGPARVSIAPVSVKTTFKRPTCMTRSRTLALQKIEENPHVPEDVVSVPDAVPLESPRSPVANSEPCIHAKPKLIPLEKIPDKTNKMPPSKIEVLFSDLVVFSAEEKALDEVVRQFSGQEAEYVAGAILEWISTDYHDPVDTKYSPAPLMTHTQRTMLGFMCRLEKTSVAGVCDSFLSLAERRLLRCKVLQEFGPITRLHLAICKLNKDVWRMRRFCCDVFYFCGDFAVPFLFTVLTSWTDVLPHAANAADMALAEVLVRIVRGKSCDGPGYRLRPLKNLLEKFYGYPEECATGDFFVQLFHNYLRSPVKSSEFALVLFCKNRPEKWVYDQIETHLKPIVGQIPAENFKAAVIILIGNLYNRFSSKSEVNYLPKIREWFRSQIEDTTPDVVKRSIYLCLNRLKKK